MLLLAGAIERCVALNPGLKFDSHCILTKAIVYLTILLHLRKFITTQITFSYLADVHGHTWPFPGMVQISKKYAKTIPDCIPGKLFWQGIRKSITVWISWIGSLHKNAFLHKTEG